MMRELPRSLAAGLLAGAAALLAVACGPTGASSIASPAPTPTARQAQPDVAAQRAAMQKLAFLVGTWSGPETVVIPSGTLTMTQTEVVESELGGLVLLLQGTGRTASGQVAFAALATVAYDDATSTYRIRAYSNGSYVDAPLTVTAQGFSWGYGGGSTKVVNTMSIDSQGRWVETTDTAVGSASPGRTVDMTLRRQS